MRGGKREGAGRPKIAAKESKYNPKLIPAFDKMQEMYTSGNHQPIMDAIKVLNGNVLPSTATEYSPELKNTFDRIQELHTQGKFGGAEWCVLDMFLDNFDCCIIDRAGNLKKYIQGD